MVAPPVLVGMVAERALQTELDRMEPELELERIDFEEFQRPFKIRSSTRLPIMLKGARQPRPEPVLDDGAVVVVTILPVEAISRPIPVDDRKLVVFG